MKKIVVAMYDEEGYTRRLADYFCQHQKNLFDVRLFTSEESLRKFLIGQGTELLITGERDWELFRGINHGIHRLSGRTRWISSNRTPAFSGYRR